jgi:hypothetical protein
LTVWVAAAFIGSLIGSKPALATEEPTKGEHGTQSTPATTESAPGSATSTSGTEATNVERGLGTGEPFELDTRFRFEAGWELHGMLVQNNLVGNGAETEFNYFYAGISYYLTKNDKLAFIAGLYQFALADPGESGWRMDDLLLRYNHHFSLPWKLGLDLGASLTAPTSFESYKMGLVTEPQMRAVLERTFFKHLTIDLRVYGNYYWQTYATIQGGSAPNPLAAAGGVLSIEAELPWHPALAIGADLATVYVDYYMPNGQPGSITGVPSNAGATGPYYGVENNPTFTSQPLQQSYGFDVYLRYDFPKWHRVRVSVELAYAQGEPTAGYSSDLIDGISNLYLFYPEASEVYSSLTVKY